MRSLVMEARLRGWCHAPHNLLKAITQHTNFPNRYTSITTSLLIMSTALQSTPPLALPATSVESSPTVVETITISETGRHIGLTNNTYATEGGNYVRIVAVKPHSIAAISGIKVGDIPVIYEGGRIINRMPAVDFIQMTRVKGSRGPKTFSVMRTIPSMAEQRKPE